MIGLRACKSHRIFSTRSVNAVKIPGSAQDSKARMRIRNSDKVRELLKSMIAEIEKTHPAPGKVLELKRAI